MVESDFDTIHRFELADDGSISRSEIYAENIGRLPDGVALDSAGNLYVTDTWNFTVRKITPAGVVTITLSRSGKEVLIAISDQGAGIPEANIARVFDRFFTHRPDATRPRASHTGLGLAIVKAIVEGYGGSITPSNNASGGATFEIRLPAA